MSAINSFNASIELQHIYLEVYSERYCHLRTFLESYYCYQHGLVTKQGKPDWVKFLMLGCERLQQLTLRNGNCLLER